MRGHGFDIVRAIIDKKHIVIVLAADPAQPRPAWPRWFDLDRFTGPPRLTNWICRCDDIAAELALSPRAAGRRTRP